MQKSNICETEFTATRKRHFDIPNTGEQNVSADDVVGDRSVRGGRKMARENKLVHFVETRSPMLFRHQGHTESPRVSKWSWGLATIL